VNWCPKDKIKVKSLMSVVGYLFKSTSFIGRLTFDQQKEVVLNMVCAASEVWSKTWAQEGSPLKRPFGIQVLLVVLRKGMGLQLALDNNQTPDLDQMRAALKLAHRFSWDSDTFGRNYNKCADALSDRLGAEFNKKRLSKAS